MDRLKSGDLGEVSAVIKALMHRDSTRGLSNGERKMLAKTQECKPIQLNNNLKL